LRHTLATKLIERWSQQSVPLAHRLVMLSQYLGHKYFHHTYGACSTSAPPRSGSGSIRTLSGGKQSTLKYGYEFIPRSPTGLLCVLRSAREVSPHTTTSYQDTFRLLLPFIAKRRRISVDQITLELRPGHDSRSLSTYNDDTIPPAPEMRAWLIRAFVRFAVEQAPQISPRHNVSWSSQANKLRSLCSDSLRAQR
jgi:hypothetical protein